MPLASGTLPRQTTELSLGSYDSGIEDAQNPNPRMEALLATQAARGLMPPPALEAAKTPSPKKACLQPDGVPGEAKVSEKNPPGSGP